MDRTIAFEAGDGGSNPSGGTRAKRVCRRAKQLLVLREAMTTNCLVVILKFRYSIFLFTKIEYR